MTKEYLVYKHFEICIEKAGTGYIYRTKNQGQWSLTSWLFRSKEEAIADVKVAIDNVAEYSKVLEAPVKDLPLFVADDFDFDATRELLAERLAKRK